MIWASSTKTTTDHDEIRRWAEEHDATTASVGGTGSRDGVGVLRIDFPGGAGEDRARARNVGRVVCVHRGGGPFASHLLVGVTKPLGPRVSG